MDNKNNYIESNFSTEDLTKSLKKNIAIIKKSKIKIENIQYQYSLFPNDTKNITPYFESIPKYNKAINEARCEIKLLLPELIKRDINIDNPFFKFCSSRNYIDKIQTNYNKYKEIFTESNEIEFYNDQIKYYASDWNFKNKYVGKYFGLFDLIEESVDEITIHNIEDSRKRKIEYLEELLSIGKEKNDNSKHYFYCKIGALFAQGYMVKKGFDYYYKSECFKSANKLSDYIKEEVLKTNYSVRQYICDTLDNRKTKGNKNIYASKSMMKNIIKYCKEKNIEPTEHFKTTYYNLED